MNKSEFKEEIAELEEAGVIETENTRDGERISFTEEGLEATEFVVGMRTDMQLFLFSLLWNNQYSTVEDPHLRLIKIAEDMRDKFEINILRTIEFEEDKLKGIELKEDLPEEFLRQFDP
jgi:hypothetical protein